MPGGVYAIMQMRGCAASVAGIAHVTNDVARSYEISGLKLTEPLQMCVIVHLPARSKNPDDIPSQVVLTDSAYDALSRGPNRCSLRRKNIDSLMSSTAFARCAPGIVK